MHISHYKRFQSNQLQLFKPEMKKELMRLQISFQMQKISTLLEVEPAIMQQESQNTCFQNMQN